MLVSSAVPVVGSNRLMYHWYPSDSVYVAGGTGVGAGASAGFE